MNIKIRAIKKSKIHINCMLYDEYTRGRVWFNSVESVGLCTRYLYFMERVQQINAPTSNNNSNNKSNNKNNNNTAL